MAFFYQIYLFETEASPWLSKGFFVVFYVQNIYIKANFKP